MFGWVDDCINVHSGYTVSLLGYLVVHVTTSMTIKMPDLRHAGIEINFAYMAIVCTVICLV